MASKAGGSEPMEINPRTSLCDLLDGFALELLSGEERSSFESHLSGCQACQEEMERDRRLSAVLARACERLESPPERLTAAVERAWVRRDRLSRLRRRFLGTAGALAAAAAVVVWAGGWLREPSRPPTELPSVRLEPAVAVQSPRPRVRVRPTADAPAIIRPIETRNPNVSIFFVHRTVKIARDGRGADGELENF